MMGSRLFNPHFARRTAVKYLFSHKLFVLNLCMLDVLDDSDENKLEYMDLFQEYTSKLGDIFCNEIFLDIKYVYLESEIDHRLRSKNQVSSAVIKGRTKKFSYDLIRSLALKSSRIYWVREEVLFASNLTTRIPFNR